MTFGKHIRMKRKQKGMLQYVLADRLKVSKVFIHQIETGKADAPSRKRCHQIAKVLELDPQELWNMSKRERLQKFMQRENIDREGLEVLTDEERHLLKLHRVLNEEMKKDFNGMVFMLFKHYENEETKKILEELLECA